MYIRIKKLFLIAKQMEKNVWRASSKSFDWLFLSDKMQCFMFTLFCVFFVQISRGTFYVWDTSQSIQQKSRFYGKLFVEEVAKKRIAFWWNVIWIKVFFSAEFLSFPFRLSFQRNEKLSEPFPFRISFHIFLCIYVNTHKISFCIHTYVRLCVCVCI